MTIGITGIINPSSTQTATPFTISTYYTSASNTLVATSSMGSITATAGQINNTLVFIALSSYVVSDTGVTYTFTFNNNNPITLNGIVIIGIPIAVTLSPTFNTFCSASISGSAFLSQICTSSSDSSYTYVNFTNLFASAPVASNTTISLKISTSFTNPGSTTSTSSFII
jgi:hypothetical protein